MIICPKCRTSLPDGTQLCNVCGNQIDESPTAPFSLGDVPSDSPGYTGAPDIENEMATVQSAGSVPQWDNASPTEVALQPTHGDHHQPLPPHADHQQPLPTHPQHYQAEPIHGAHYQAQPFHGEHHQAQPFHGAVHQAEPMHGAYYQAQPVYSEHYQPEGIHTAHKADYAKHLKKAQSGLRSPFLITAISSLVVVSLVAVTLLIAYVTSTPNKKIPPKTTTANVTLVTSGQPIPGQALQVVGNHFTPGQTVFVTMDGKALDKNETAMSNTSSSSALSLPLVRLSFADSIGTPVIVQLDGTFTLTINIPMEWAGSTHHLSVSDQQGKELKSLDLSIQGNPSTPASTPTSTPTPTPITVPTLTSTPTPTPAPVVRTLTSLQTQTQTVNATGQGTIPGTQATGTIEVTNLGGTPLQLPAGTTLTNTAGCTAQGLAISLDSAVNLAPFNVDFAPSTSVAIHVVQAGIAGNIKDCSQAANAISTTTRAFEYCSPNCSSTATFAYDLNGGFSGGTDAQNYTTVQQSDINTATTALEASTKQKAIADMTSQLHTNEHLVGDAQCTYKATSDHAAGDKAATVTVTVQATCTGKAST